MLRGSRPMPPSCAAPSNPLALTRGSETFLAITQAHSQQTLAIARVLFGIATCYRHCIIRGRLWPPPGRNPGAFLATCVAPFGDVPGQSVTPLAACQLRASLAAADTSFRTALAPLVAAKESLGSVPGHRQGAIWERPGDSPECCKKKRIAQRALE